MAVPVEVLPFSLGIAIRGIEKLNGTPILRISGRNYYLSDNNNYVLDADFGALTDPKKMEHEINEIPGVVDNGIFTDMASDVFVGSSYGVKTLKR